MTDCCEVQSGEFRRFRICCTAIWTRNAFSCAHVSGSLLFDCVRVHIFSWSRSVSSISKIVSWREQFNCKYAVEKATPSVWPFDRVRFEWRESVRLIWCETICSDLLWSCIVCVRVMACATGYPHQFDPKQLKRHYSMLRVRSHRMVICHGIRVPRTSFEANSRSFSPEPNYDIRTAAYFFRFGSESDKLSCFVQRR